MFHGGTNFGYWNGKRSWCPEWKEAQGKNEWSSFRNYDMTLRSAPVAPTTYTGLTTGADEKGRFLPITTSYDYDAPISEAGDPTPKLFAIRNVISKVPLHLAVANTDAVPRLLVKKPADGYLGYSALLSTPRKQSPHPVTQIWPPTGSQTGV